MAKMVKCVKLGQELEGFDEAPVRGELGERIKQNVSKKAWQMWVEHSKMIVNEYRFELNSPQGQRILLEEAEKYFFGEGAQLPPDYRPPAAK